MHFKYKRFINGSMIAVSLFVYGEIYSQFIFQNNEQTEDVQNQNNQSHFNDNSIQHPPDQSVDECWDCDDYVPIDDWLFLLPLAGMAIGFYFLRKRRKLA